MLLNDVQPNKRLAYLLGFTIERHVCGSGFWTARGIAVIGAAALLLFFLWRIVRL